MKQFDQGQTVRLLTAFKNFDGVPTDPSAVRFYIQRDADSEWAVYEYDAIDDSSSDSSFSDGPVRVSEGVFYLDVDTTAQSGVWKWRVVGTGAAPSAKQGSFYITPMDPDDSDPNDSSS